MTTPLVPRRLTWTRRLAVALKATQRYLKFLVKSAPIAYPCRVECNVCGWRGKHFLSDAWHRHTNCPKCRAGVRHRLLFAALSQAGPRSFESLVTDRRVLHFAPEPVVQMRIKRLAACYLTADYLNPRRDLQLDISDMHMIKNSEFDLVIACDVLEHVADDRRAMREIFRVLRPGGCAILTVPQKDDLTHTYEDASIVSDADRLRAFGQRDHVRMYGSDFADRLTQEGFKVTEINERAFSGEQVQRNVLFPPQRSEHPLATNFRNVFFCEKDAGVRVQW